MQLIEVINKEMADMYLALACSYEQEGRNIMANMMFSRALELEADNA